MTKRSLTLVADSEGIQKHNAEDTLHGVLRTLAPLGAGISATLATFETLETGFLSDVGDIEHFLYAAAASVLAGLLGQVHKFVNSKLLVEDALEFAEKVIEDE